MSPADIQEFYEVSLLDNQRRSETSKASGSPAPLTLWDLSSLQGPPTSDSPPSFSTSTEVSSALPRTFQTWPRFAEHVCKRAHGCAGLGQARLPGASLGPVVERWFPVSPVHF